MRRALGRMVDGPGRGRGGRGGHRGGQGDFLRRRSGPPRRRPAPPRRPQRSGSAAILALDILAEYRSNRSTSENSASENSASENSAAPVVGLKADTDAEVLIRAMCNVAKADGSMSEDEQKRIVNRFDDLDDDEQAFLAAELGAPRLSAEEIAQIVPDDLVAATYTFSAMVIDIDRSSERQYLRELAVALGIDDFDRDTIHADLSIDSL